MANLPIYGRNETAITARESDTPNADFDNGLNLGASNAPGIGICTDVINPKLSDWTVADQFGVTRDPQGSQHVGIVGDEVGSDNKLLSYPVQAAQYEVTPGVDDINDTVSFLVADQQAAPGAVFHAGSGAVNRGLGTVEIGDRAWGVVPVA